MSETTLYIFIDESGNFDFSPTGSKYFILSGLSTLTPLHKRSAITDIKYSLLSKGEDIEYFHATEDKQIFRDEFYKAMKSIDGFEIDSVIAEKSKALKELYEEITIDSSLRFSKRKAEEKFYRLICETLLKYIIRRYINFKDSIKIERVVVVLDKILTGQKRSFITKQIKMQLKKELGVVPHVYFHQMKSDVNCQMVDYCCWAIASKWTKGELRPYNEIKEKVKSEFEIFKSGKISHY
jgi:hypothetical protein